jgi:hypothetical protein
MRNGQVAGSNIKATFLSKKDSFQNYKFRKAVTVREVNSKKDRTRIHKVSSDLSISRTGPKPMTEPKLGFFLFI